MNRHQQIGPSARTCRARAGLLIGILALLAGMSGCETLRGAGRDLQSAGDRMSNIVNRVNFLW